MEEGCRAERVGLTLSRELEVPHPRSVRGSCRETALCTPHWSQRSYSSSQAPVPGQQRRPNRTSDRRLSDNAMQTNKLIPKVMIYMYMWSLLPFFPHKWEVVKDGILKRHNLYSLLLRHGSLYLEDGDDWGNSCDVTTTHDQLISLENVIGQFKEVLLSEYLERMYDITMTS